MAENKSMSQFESPCNNNQLKSPDHCLLNSDIAKGESGWAYPVHLFSRPTKVYIFYTSYTQLKEQYNMAQYPFQCQCKSEERCCLSKRFVGFTL